MGQFLLGRLMTDAFGSVGGAAASASPGEHPTTNSATSASLTNPPIDYSANAISQLMQMVQNNSPTTTPTQPTPNQPDLDFAALLRSLFSGGNGGMK